MNYLKPEKIVETISILKQRIHERFPKSGLFQVCGDLLLIAENAEKKTQWFSAPVVWLRGLCWLISILIVCGSIGTLWVVGEETKNQSKSEVRNFEDDKVPAEGEGTPEDAASRDKSEANLGVIEFVQVLEAGINDIVLIGAAIFFLMTLETRYKRGRALESVHELRSIAHIIDMHQLTKDPERITNKNYSLTTTSPKPTMTPFELRRYFDYCSEMLSLTGKIAAVYVQDFNDSVTLASVNEVETLCTGLSRKIWQKVSILQDVENESAKSNVTETSSPKGPDEGAKPDSTPIAKPKKPEE